MDLISAKVEAASTSKKASGILHLIVSDKEGECSIVEGDTVPKGHELQAMFKNGSEIFNKEEGNKETKKKESAPKVSKKEKESAPSKKQSKKPVYASAPEEPEEEQETNESSSDNENETMQKTKKAKPAKKAAKKGVTTPKKKVEAKVLKPEKNDEPIKAESLAAGVKEVIKQGLKAGVLSIKGKLYSFSLRASWAISKKNIDTAGEGFIMIIKDQGYYTYKKSDFKELFGKIFSSGTWKNIGIYSQSTLPKWHAEMWTDLK